MRPAEQIYKMTPEVYLGQELANDTKNDDVAAYLAKQVEAAEVEQTLTEDKKMR